MSMIEDVISIGDDNSVRNWSNIKLKLEIQKENYNVNGGWFKKIRFKVIIR